MKNKTAILIISILTLGAFATFGATQSLKSAGFLYNEATSALNSRSYPVAVRLADTLIENYPRSLYLPRTLLLKGKAQFALCNFVDAVTTLKRADELFSQNDGFDKSECIYFLARALDENGSLAPALDKYNEYCKFNIDDKTPLPHRAATIFYMGSIYFRAGEFEKAIPFFESVENHCEKYEAKTFFEALCKLLSAYNKTNQSAKVIALYESEKLLLTKTKPSNEGTEAQPLQTSSENPFDDNTIKLYIADAYALSHDTKNAFNLYCEIFATKSTPAAAIALKKAFTLFATGDKSSTALLDIENVKQNLLSLQGKVSQELGDDIISEFWTRLGVDAYQKGDDAGALKCFDEAEKSASLQMFLLASLYRAKIVAGRTPTPQSAKDAIATIEQYRSILNDETRSILFCETNNLLATYYFTLGDYSKALSCASVVTPSTAQTREVTELALFQKREYEALIKYCEKDATMSKTALQALATSYLRTGNSEKALLTYGALFDNGLLSGAQLSDYAVLLLQNGEVQKAFDVAKKCSDLPSSYTKGLAAFQLGDYEAATKALAFFCNNTTSKNTRTKSYALFYEGVALFNLKKTNEAYLTLLDFVASFPRHEFYHNAQYLCALCARNLGDVSLAKDHLQDAATSKDPNIAQEASELLIELLWEEGERTQSLLNKLTDFSKHFPQSPKIAAVYFKAGAICEQLGNKERAILHYELSFSKASQEDEIKAESAKRLYELYTAKKDYEHATNYEQVLKTPNEEGKADD